MRSVSISNPSNSQLVCRQSHNVINQSPLAGTKTIDNLINCATKAKLNQSPKFQSEPTLLLLHPFLGNRLLLPRSLKIQAIHLSPIADFGKPIALITFPGLNRATLRCLPPQVSSAKSANQLLRSLISHRLPKYPRKVASKEQMSSQLKIFANG